MKKILLSILSLLAGCMTGMAENNSDSVNVFFRQSHVVIDPAYNNNGTRLDSILAKINLLKQDSLTTPLKSIKVVGGASPEGTLSFNEYLSEKRAGNIFSFFREHDVYLPDSIVSFTFLGRDWNGLRNEVLTDMNVPFRDDVLSLLDSVCNADTGKSSVNDEYLKKLKTLHGGKPYSYLYDRLFPGLRASHLVVEYERLYPSIELPDPNVFHSGINTLTDIPPMPSLLPLMVYGKAKTCKPFYMGLKSNLLIDALLIPNIGAEFYVGKNWSVLGNWMYGWWDRDASHRYWRAYGGDLGVRWWFGKKANEKPLTGHHIGLFAGVVTYDFEFGGTGIMGGIPGRTLWDRCNVYGGIEYGYSLPVTRRLNIDFSIGVGYLGGKYYKYVPEDGYYVWQSTHRLKWFGPVKAEVSLVWLIGCDNYNRGKGGK